MPREGVSCLQRLKVFCAARSWLLARHGADVVAGCPHHTPRAAAAISHTAGWRHPRALAFLGLPAPRPCCGAGRSSRRPHMAPASLPGRPCGVCGATILGLARHGMPATTGRAAQTPRDALGCRARLQARTRPLSWRQRRRSRLRRPVSPPVMWLIWQHFFGQGYERIRPASLNPAGVM